MASEENHPVYGDEDLDEDDDDESEEEDLDLTKGRGLILDEDDVDEDDDEDDDTSSSNLAAGEGILPPSSTSQVTVAVASDPTASAAQTVTIALPADSFPDPKRQRIDGGAIAGMEKAVKPLAVFDESRRLFQRLWTDEDEIELLQGFLDYTRQRVSTGGGNSASHHHDTSAFYDQIKNKLQLDFNKNQLVEKLRRLKKKYRNVISKIGSGKGYVFKSPHDHTTFEISCKIWSADGSRAGGGGAEEGGLEDDETNHNPTPNANSIDHSNNYVDANSSEKKPSRSRKRPRGVKIEETPQFHQLTTPTATPTVTATPIPNLIEETVRSCLSPLFKDLLHNTMNGPGGSRGLAGMALNSMPFGFGGPSLSFTGGDVMEEKWRKQQILELEVYSKRLELVQEQIKSALEELRSMGS